MWGITFSFIMPIIFLIIGAYVAGEEYGRKIKKENKVL